MKYSQLASARTTARGKKREPGIPKGSERATCLSGSSERRIACPIPKNPPPRYGLDLDSPGSIFGSSHGSNVPVEECDQVHFDSFVIFHHQSEHAPCVGWQTPHTQPSSLSLKPSTRVTRVGVTVGWAGNSANAVSATAPPPS